MGKTSSEVKNRYNKKAYDTINFVVLKGEKEKIKQQSLDKGFDSVGAYIKNLIENDK